MLGKTVNDISDCGAFLSDNSSSNNNYSHFNDLILKTIPKGRYYSNFLLIDEEAEAQTLREPSTHDLIDNKWWNLDSNPGG